MAEAVAAADHTVVVVAEVIAKTQASKSKGLKIHRAEDKLLSPFFRHPTNKIRHFDRSGPQFHRGPRSGETPAFAFAFAVALAVAVSVVFCCQLEPANAFFLKLLLSS
ncbi:hypothetical protein [Tunturibacter empetritectus]|uniref:Uncharacterized protein n=1 Tax=Tunturiibacter lichenicola TaxID=2051959 RepID=A0A7W8J594_9BACT|nr:hypothetical protein [Edaphobacter lichenicola]MBB5342862.1 hypothetical protein [Edaphobacter lichenicola]